MAPNSALKFMKLKIRMNKAVTALNEDGQIVTLCPTTDLRFNALKSNMAMVNHFNEWRIDKIVTHWKLNHYNRFDFTPEVRHAIVYNIPNDSNGADGAFESIRYSSDADVISALLYNYTQLSGVNYKKVPVSRGSVTWKPYVTEAITTYCKESTAAPTVATDVRRNYKPTFRYKSSAVRYEAPWHMCIPGFVPRQVSTSGRITAGGATTDVDLDSSNLTYPNIEIWSDVYVTVKGYDELSLASAGKKAFPEMEEATFLEDLNMVNADIKNDIKNHVVNEISNTHPAMALAASVLGLRANKRTRDEIK